MRTAIIVLALLVCSAGAGGAQSARKSKPVTHTVTIDATSYRPATVTLKRGDTVVWENKDVIPHTATSKKAGLFDSGTIAPGGKWKMTFKTEGDVEYFCTFHPTMQGTLRVK